MSRKDPRRTKLVPLTRDEWQWLRRKAGGRSLADAVRRLAVARGLREPLPAAPEAGTRCLPVQFPRAVRRRFGGSVPGDAGAMLAALVREEMERSKRSSQGDFGGASGAAPRLRSEHSPQTPLPRPIALSRH